MKFYNFLFNIAAAILLHSCFAIPPGKKILMSLPEHEREDFITFSLGDGYTKNATHIQRMPDIRFPDALGIPDELVDKFQKLDVPQNFTTKLYVWVKDRFNINQTDIRQLILYRMVCLNGGQCIEIGDIGGLCCPF